MHGPMNIKFKLNL